MGFGEVLLLLARHAKKPAHDPLLAVRYSGERIAGAVRISHADMLAQSAGQQHERGTVGGRLHCGPKRRKDRRKFAYYFKGAVIRRTLT